MKSIVDCEKGCNCKVLKIEATGALKSRLISFGIMKNANIELLACAPAKKTFEIKVGKMRLALRDEEAKLIKVTDEEN